MPRYVVLQENGVESDPLSGSEVLRWVRDGRIQPSTLIRGAGARKWHKAMDIPAIAAVLPATDSDPADVDIYHPDFDPDSVWRPPSIPSKHRPIVPRATDSSEEHESDFEFSSIPPDSIPTPPTETHEARNKTSSTPILDTILPIFLIVSALLILYFTGWSVYLAATPDMSMLARPQLAIPGVCFLNPVAFGFLINGKVVGMGITARFFDAPLLQWVGFIAAFSMLSTGLHSTRGRQQGKPAK
jgi:hypothetical protein